LTLSDFPRHGQANGDQQPALGMVSGCYIAAMQLNGLFGNRQTHPAPAAMAIPGFSNPVKWSEQLT
jgi:hypothetical protein